MCLHDSWGISSSWMKYIVFVPLTLPCILCANLAISLPYKWLQFSSCFRCLTKCMYSSSSPVLLSKRVPVNSCNDMLGTQLLVMFLSMICCVSVSVAPNAHSWVSVWVFLLAHVLSAGQLSKLVDPPHPVSWYLVFGVLYHWVTQQSSRWCLAVNLDLFAMVSY